jgi:hypothetical protein
LQQGAGSREQGAAALGALGALAACCRSCELGLPCEGGARSDRPRGALAGIGDIIAGITGAVTGTITTLRAEARTDTDRFWAGVADNEYAGWLDYWTRTGEIPARPNCGRHGRDGAPWCSRAWERFLITVSAEQQTTFRTFATPEVIVAGILFVLAVRASGRA